jgi:DNA-binding LytR/AlgR family response regulator
MKINCIAVDDEPLALEKIRGYIRKIDYLELLESFTNGIEAMNFMRQASVDLVFLDIQMEELTGIQMLEVMKQKPKVILTTAYDEYALKGYELDVSDYLLKPISFQRFLKAVEKVYASLEGRPQKEPLSVPASPTECPDHIFVKSGSATVRIDVGEILFVEGMKDYLRIWTPAAKVMTLMSFKHLEELLPDENFVRIHKSYLVAMNKIDSIERSRVRIAGELLPVGESYKRQFLERIKEG